ncbi:hypothetical protein L3081_22970 [Colwellia sp. MSW7]|uniref:Uncharacterized protein n=1 Tax=Colwellia maritima TaxID=2912588 RepID=A0ABS9X8A2_9GAMM|nr:hypothetical protein [Colwellia maritima]MCI2285716.1 hypothetical protein [Colwellia maritima]
MKHFTLPLITCLALSACSTFDPYTGEEKATNTAKGAGIGLWSCSRSCLHS